VGKGNFVAIKPFGPPGIPSEGAGGIPAKGRSIARDGSVSLKELIALLEIYYKEN
jgi:hypothetical protein